MTLCGMVRGLGYLGAQVWGAARFAVQPTTLPVGDADRLAEMEAAYDVGEADCGMGCSSPGCCAPTPPDTTRYPETNGVNEPENEDFAVAPLTADEITAVRRFLESSAAPASRTAVEEAEQRPGDGLSPPSSGHLHTLGNDPASTYQRMMRRRLEEDRDPE